MDGTQTKGISKLWLWQGSSAHILLDWNAAWDSSANLWCAHKWVTEKKRTVITTLCVGSANFHLMSNSTQPIWSSNQNVRGSQNSWQCYSSKILWTRLIVQYLSAFIHLIKSTYCSVDFNDPQIMGQQFLISGFLALATQVIDHWLLQFCGNQAKSSRTVRKGKMYQKIVEKN